ncbi:putative thioredoxin [Sulfuritortus calidifontis]|uniref:Thioredoxin n=1 Tax=Sulfuritortus calidifontis TaxID=1914471 RepID=A0A4R3JQL1_9PROT|nr:thioredoxin domain-containing protein [Sulfuritortus calidifontis]TCS69210.1 putative thioredoxin [Sulfuritortus calidifontis]
MTLQHHDKAHDKAVAGRLIFDTDLEHFERDVVEASKQHLVLVDLWADWCGPCHFLSPVLGKVIPEYAGKVRLAKVEVDEGDNMKIAGRHGARGFPTVLLYKNGEMVDRFHGAKPEHFVREFIDQHLDA